MTTVAEDAGTAAATGTARRAMIDSQLRTSGVTTPRVVRAMEAVPREDYLPADKRGHAYIDRAIPLADGGALAAPVVQGKMLEEAMPQAGEKVLVLENGSGYLAALVAEMGADVTSEAAASAATSKKKGEYDLILVDGAAEQLPPAIAKRLGPDGRIVTGIVEKGVTRLARGKLAGKSVALLPVGDVGMPVIAAFAAEKSWTF